MDYNPYGDAESNNAFSVSDYVTCSQVDMTYQQQQAQEGQEDQDGQQQQQQGQGQQYFNYYVGPYCANQGGSIFLGLFTDDSCTTFADASGGRETYFQYKYTNLPYSSTNIVDMDCLSCKEPTENNADGNDAEDTDTVMEACESIYTTAGKCEAALPYGTAYAPNSNACKYIEGIKILRQDGTTVSSSSQAKANKTASVFIGIFSTSFVLLSAYVYYLKTKLDRASINIAE